MYIKESVFQFPIWVTRSQLLKNEIFIAQRVLIPKDQIDRSDDWTDILSIFLYILLVDFNCTF